MDRLRENDRIIGANIQRIARKKGTNGAELERICGITPRYISQWKNGTKRPRGGEIYAIAAALKVSVNKLFEGCE